MTLLLVVTLPPSLDALSFARAAASAGADRLEIRTDLTHVSSPDLAALHAIIPLLVARRTPDPLPRLPAGAWLDTPLEAPAPCQLLSHHAPVPLDPRDALALWTHAAVDTSVHIKHVEPVGSHATAARLMETQRLLSSEFGAHRVTVLGTGEEAVPWRCILSTGNALDYAALSPSWRAAPGQRLLADARRTRGHSGPRLGILGSGLDASRSPRIHPQPFDRLDLPPSADLAALLPALLPFYRGLAVTSPFKRPVAAALHAAFPSVNTLWSSQGQWHSTNTDVAGARHVLSRLPPGPLTVLGDGGVTDALRAAVPSRPLRVLRRQDAGIPVSGSVVWTWPAHVEPPAGLTLGGARVVVVAYGPPAKLIAHRIQALGGVAVRAGPAWLVAQAREQRRLWTEAG